MRNKILVAISVTIACSVVTVFLATRVQHLTLLPEVCLPPGKARQVRGLVHLYRVGIWVFPDVWFAVTQDGMPHVAFGHATPHDSWPLAPVIFI